MKSTFSLFVSFLSLFWMSCTPDPLDIAVPQASTKPVISSQYIPGGLLTIALSRSFSAVTNPDIHVDSNGLKVDPRLLFENAEVWIHVGERSEKLPEVEQGVYALENFILPERADCSLEVKWNGRLIATAQETKQEVVPFDSVIAYRTSGKDLHVYYRVNLPATGQEYFVVNYFTKKSKDSIPAQPDPDYIARRLLQQNSGYDLFTRGDFRNGQYIISKEVAGNYESDTLMIGLSGISEGYYRFLLAQKKAGSLFNQLRGEVINFPSNVQGGHGYFNLAEPDLRILNVE